MQLIFDTHHLVGQDFWLIQNKPELSHCNSKETAVAELNKTANQWLACIFPFPSSRDGSYIAENATILQAASWDRRLLPVLAVNPSSPLSRKYARSVLREKNPVVGLILWPILCELDLVALASDSWFSDFLAEFPLPVTVHVASGREFATRGLQGVKRCQSGDALYLASVFPNIRFNLSHALRLSTRALNDLQGLNNVFSDMSGLSGNGRWIESGVNVFAAEDAGELASMPMEDVIRTLVKEWRLEDRLMFGSTFPLCKWWQYDVRRETETVIAANLSDPELSSIFSDNATRFYSNWSSNENLARGVEN